MDKRYLVVLGMIISLAFVWKVNATYTQSPESYIVNLTNPDSLTYEINDLNDSSTDKNLTFDSASSKLVWIEIPKNSIVTKAEWKLSDYCNHLNATLTDDTHSWNSSPDTNYENYPELPVGYVYGATHEKSIIFLKFNLSNINFTPNFVELHLEESAMTDKSSIELNLINITNDTWIENEITWNNRPQFNNILVAFNTSSDGWTIITSSLLTEFVSNAYKTDNLTSFGINKTNELAGTYWFNAKEMKTLAGYEYADESRLVIYYNCTSNITIDSGDDGINDYINTTYFKGSETINLNTTAINNYLSTCSADSNGLCNVPFNISSDSAGKLKISAINITFEQENSNMSQLILYIDNGDDYTIYWNESFVIGCHRSGHKNRWMVFADTNSNNRLLG
jgi:hypothetical protein